VHKNNYLLYVFAIMSSPISFISSRSWQ